VPDELMGRVGATSRLIALSAGPLGALFGGWLAHVAGLRAPIVFGAAVLATMVVMAARLTSNKRSPAGRSGTNKCMHFRVQLPPSP
jgi:hypothetical protein